MRSGFTVPDSLSEVLLYCVIKIHQENTYEKYHLSGIAGCCTSSHEFGEEQHKQQEGDTAQGVKALSQDLRDLLSQEMVALQDGMVSIIPAYASGNWDEIVVTAGKIKNSYIIKQRLTERQKKELHAVLPPEFIEKDQKIHYFSGMLEHAAQQKIKKQS